MAPAVINNTKCQLEFKSGILLMLDNGRTL